MHLAIGVNTPVLTFFLTTRPEYVRPSLDTFFACMIEDSHGKPGNELLPLVNDIPIEKALSDYTSFTTRLLNWQYSTTPAAAPQDS